jgi:hypothetical protein
MRAGKHARAFAHSFSLHTTTNTATTATTTTTSIIVTRI